MILFLLSGLALLGAAVALAGHALTISRARAVETVRHIGDYGYGPSGPAGEEERRRSAIAHVASRIGVLLVGRFGKLGEDDLRRQLIAAGLYRTHPRDFMGYRVLSAVLVPALLWWLLSSGGASILLVVLGIAAGAAGGWSLPLSFLRRRAQRRATEIDYDLPELIDLLVVSVEAGVGFSGAIQLAAPRFAGALGDELRLLLQEQRMGLSTMEALRNMVDRCETPAMRSFVRSTIQGEALGVSIGEIMRSLARDMRIRRRQSAEERAQKAPVKMLFPLIFLIFPAMFVVVLGPAVSSLLSMF